MRSLCSNKNQPATERSAERKVWEKIWEQNFAELPKISATPPDAHLEPSHPQVGQRASSIGRASVARRAGCV